MQPGFPWYVWDDVFISDIAISTATGCSSIPEFSSWLTISGCKRISNGTRNKLDVILMPFWWNNYNVMYLEIQIWFDSAIWTIIVQCTKLVRVLIPEVRYFLFNYRKSFNSSMADACCLDFASAKGWQFNIPWKAVSNFNRPYFICIPADNRLLLACFE